MNFTDIAREREEYRNTHRLYYYDPYPFQREFHHAKGLETDFPAEQIGLICANQIGKTTAGAAETAYHALGEYPDWWEGVRYHQAVTILCCGVSNDSTKRIIQHELLGGMKDTKDWGTGMIPRSRLGEPTRKAGVPNAYESVIVKGRYGDSVIWFMAYEQGWQKFQGVRFHFGWPDEEPPEDIWSQMLRGTISQKNSRIAMTMTPEEGFTSVVTGFMTELKHGQACVTATWDDAKHTETTKNHKAGDTHLTDAKKKQILAALPPWQRDMRSKGIPLMGSGLVFPIKEESIVIDPIEIPRHWRRICGIDFGIDHPFGSAWIAHDVDNDVVHIYSDYSQRGATPPTHASAIKSRGDWIPIAWPHDGLAKDKGSGIPLADLYRKEGLNLLTEKFSNPPGPNQKEGQGGQGVEVGIIEMWNRMETGRLKVHRNCQDWLTECRQYHRKDGQIVKIKDDCISASRYAIQSLRFAYTMPVRRANVVQLRGATNW